MKVAIIGSNGQLGSDLGIEYSRRKGSRRAIGSADLAETACAVL